MHIIYIGALRGDRIAAVFTACGRQNETIDKAHDIYCCNRRSHPSGDHPRRVPLGTQRDQLDGFHHALSGQCDRRRGQQARHRSHCRGHLPNRHQNRRLQQLRILLLHPQPHGVPRQHRRPRLQRCGHGRTARHRLQRPLQLLHAVVVAGAPHHDCPARGALLLHHAQDQRREQQGAQLRQDQGDAGARQQGPLLRCGGRGRGKAGAAGNRRVSERPQEVHRHRCENPQRRAPRRPSRNGQNPVRKGRCG